MFHPLYSYLQEVLKKKIIRAHELSRALVGNKIVDIYFEYPQRNFACSKSFKLKSFVPRFEKKKGKSVTYLLFDVKSVRFLLYMNRSGKHSPSGCRRD